MNWIDDFVAIGNYLDARDTNLRREAGFRSVLSLDGSTVEAEASALDLDDVVTIQLIDGPGNDIAVFRSAVDALIELVESAPPVLVHCHAGRSRSVAVVAGYLMRTRGLTPHSAVKHISSKRDIALTDALRLLLDRL